MAEEKKKAKNYYPESQKKWNQNNKAHKKHLNYRSYTKTFINSMASVEELQEIKILIDKKLELS